MMSSVTYVAERNIYVERDVRLRVIIIIIITKGIMYSLNTHIFFSIYYLNREKNT